MGGGGKVVRNAEIPGPRAIINSTPRTPSISPDIELWPEGHETQITSTKRAREEAFLDTLPQRRVYESRVDRCRATLKTGFSVGGSYHDYLIMP